MPILVYFLLFSVFYLYQITPPEHEMYFPLLWAQMLQHISSRYVCVYIRYTWYNSYTHARTHEYVQSGRLHKILSLRAIYSNASQFNPLVLSLSLSHPRLNSAIDILCIYKTNNGTMKLLFFELIQMYLKRRRKKENLLNLHLCWSKCFMKRILHLHFTTATES